MASPIKPIFSLQDTATYRNLFNRAGVKTSPKRDFSQYQILLEQGNLPPVDRNQEAIIIALEIQAKKRGFLSLLKDIAISVDDVSLYWFAERKNEKFSYHCNYGEFIVTNARIILLTYKSDTTEPNKIYSDPFDYLKIHHVSYEENMLVLKTSRAYDMCLHFKFPTYSVLTGLGTMQWGDDTAKDHMIAMQNKQSVADYKDKATNAKSLIYQFFLNIRESSQTTPELSTPDQEKQDITALIKKLNELKEAGILTDMEFQEKKKDLLSRL